MKIYFKTNASKKIGAGHIYRCLTLADAFKKRGDQVAFMCRKQEGDLISWLHNDRGHIVHSLSQAKDDSWLGCSVEEDLQQTTEVLQDRGKADWLIVDNYGIDSFWESQVRPLASKIFVIDDLVNREHDCDLLLDQNILTASQASYSQLVPDSCRCLLGPQYALIRHEFLKMRQVRPKNKGDIKNILVFLGGCQHEAIVSQIHTLMVSFSQFDFHFVNAPASFLKVENCKVYHNVTDMAGLMRDMDLYLGSGGSITWERCCLGLPGVVFSVAENQHGFSKELGDADCQVFLGEVENVSMEAIEEALLFMAHNSEKMRGMVERMMGLVDGLGVDRVLKVI